MESSSPTRFIGLDIHKKYFVAAGVDRKLNPVLGVHEAPIRSLERWARKYLTPEDAVVVEMTTNTYAVYDTLKPIVGSVTVVHPPHVALIVRAQVKTDKKAAQTLAQLHAAGLLPGVWIPPVEVRQLRAIVAHRRKMVKLASIAKCRLHALTHRHGFELPPGFEPFSFVAAGSQCFRRSISTSARRIASSTDPAMTIQLVRLVGRMAIMGGSGSSIHLRSTFSGWRKSSAISWTEA